MSKNITAQQLAGNQKAYGIDEFRNMVNYTNTTNKGYVRFRLTSEGLKLEKINNKIDFPLSWRSNVSAAHNMAIRTKFLQAMENDLKYMGDAGTTIRNLIITPKKTDGTLDAGKALSRRDIKAVFEKFDAQFNNGVGRQVILNNFMKAAKAVCGFSGTDDDFAQYYLRTDEHGIDHRFTDYITSKDDYANLPPSERMVKSEIEFRSLLHQLENLVDDAKMRLQTENKLKSIATACAKNNGDFGMVISDNDLSVVRSSLVKLLNKAGVEDVDLGFGHKNAGLEMFLKNVLPVVVRQGVENLRELPDMNDQASVEQVLDAEFNIDRIFTLAKEFIEGAKKAVAEPAPDGKSGNAAVDALKELTKNVSKKAKEAAVLMRAREVFVLNMHGANGQNMQLAHQVANMTDDFIVEAKLDLFTATFIKDKFVKVADQVEMPDENAYLQKANECINKIRVAGQLNFGERWKKDPNAKVDANLKLKAGGDAQKFLKEVSDRTVALVNEKGGGVKGGGVPMYENLMSRTLPAILNQKIGNSVKSGGAARVNIDEQAYDDVMARLKTTRDIYCTFRDGKGAVLMEKAISSFTRQIDRLLKKGNIDAQTYNTLLADFTNRIKGGMKRAVEKFFELTPPHTKSDPKEVEKDGLRHLENFFNEEKGEVLADMRQRIATYVITRGFGGEVRNKLLNQLDERVNECAAKLKANGVELKFQDEGTTLTTALTKLYYKVLADQCDSKKIAGKPLDDAFVNKVLNAFYAAAKELVNSTNKLADVLDRDMKLMITTATNRLFEKEEPEDPEPLCSEYKPAVGKEGGITKDEYKATKESMENDLAVTLQTKVDELKNNFLRNPEAYSKKNVGDFKSASDLFPNVGKDGLYTEDSILRMQLNTINKKITTVQGWINANGTNGEPKLEDTLAADEKARIKAKYESEGPDKKIPANEISNIVERAVKEVLATADKYPLSYATGDKAKFLDRVNKQVQALVDKHVQAYETFREQFVKDAQPILDKYVDALKTETKSGRQVAEEKMLQVLDSISSEKDVPKIKGFATAFDGMLKKLVDEKIDMKMDAFLVYSKKVTSAYEKCMPVFTEAVMKFAREKLLPTKIGADEADIAFLQNKLLPVLREKFEDEIQKAGEEYKDPYNGTNAIALSELKARHCAFRAEGGELYRRHGVLHRQHEPRQSRVRRTPDDAGQGRPHVALLRGRSHDRGDAQDHRHVDGQRGREEAHVRDASGRDDARGIREGQPARRGRGRPDEDRGVPECAARRAPRHQDRGARKELQDQRGRARVRHLQAVAEAVRASGPDRVHARRREDIPREGRGEPLQGAHRQGAEDDRRESRLRGTASLRRLSQGIHGLPQQTRKERDPGSPHGEAPERKDTQGDRRSVERRRLQRPRAAGRSRRGAGPPRRHDEELQRPHGHRHPRPRQDQEAPQGLHRHARADEALERAHRDRVQEPDRRRQPDDRQVQRVRDFAQEHDDGVRLRPCQRQKRDRQNRGRGPSGVFRRQGHLERQGHRPELHDEERLQRCRARRVHQG